MKKIKLIFAFCIITSINAFCQPWATTIYGGSTDYYMCSGRICFAAPGLVMVSYAPTGTATTASFMINRTDTGGTMTSAAITRTYTVNHASSGCLGATSAANFYYGVSLIETSLPSIPSRTYALAGATNKGVFFATLQSNLAPVGTSLYRFPTGAFSITQPLIVESTATQEYFICGSYSLTSQGAYLYLLKVDEFGAILFSRTFQVASGVELIPRDMILSPYAASGNDELVIVGKANDFSGNAGNPNIQGFFMRIKQSDITNIVCRLYGQQTSNACSDWFSAVTAAASTVNGDGFVVAGHSDSISTSPIWVEKLDRSGVPIWSNLYKTHFDNTNATVDPVDVIERYSSHYSRYEYYAATTCTAGMRVIKLDDNGAIYTSTASIDNKSEFKYQNNAGNPSQAVALSYLDNGGMHDKRIHVFGTYDSATGQMYFAEAPFNGFMTIPGQANSCDSSGTANMVSQQNGPIRSSTVGISTTSGLTRCTNFSIASTTISLSPTTNCLNHHLVSGQSSLNKESATGLSTKSLSSNLLSIYPNPAKEKITVEINLYKNSNLEIELFDALGRFIIKLPVLAALHEGSQTFDIDLEKFSLKNGIYFLNTNINGQVHNQKLIYNKD